LRLIAVLAAKLLAGPVLANAPPDAAAAFPDVAALSQKEFAAAGLVLLFSVLCFIVAALLKRVSGFGDENVIRILALVLIVSGTLFLVTLGYSAEQIAPALGILGTIAGYMLGRADRDKDRDPKP
jgi:hypothetical protein